MSKFLIVLFVTIPVLLWGNKRVYTTKKIESSIIVDGNLNDEAWLTANWSSDFTMFYPYDNKPATHKTSFAIIYDDDYIYVAMKAFDDEPDKIVKRLTRRDDIDGDWMGLQFDSYHDLQTSYEFKVSAAGTKRDMYTSGDGDEQDRSWNAIWWAKTSITEDGWVAEMKIPFSQLRFVNNNVQTWGLQLGRYVQRDEETSLWTQKKRDDAGWVHHFGEMEGIVDIKPKKVFDLYPYAVGSLNTYEAEDGNPFQDGNDWDGNVGLDGKVGLTNNLTLDFTVNPDFGQVEADPSTVNLSGFELFFDERRPFFVEGSNIMNFSVGLNGGGGGENLFYSRRIGRNPNHSPELVDDDTKTEYSKQPHFTRILGAAKITGRTENGLSIGVLESITAKEEAKIQDTDGEERTETVEPLTNYAVVSLEKDFDKGSTLLGGTFTSANRLIGEEYLEFLHKNAYSGGLSFTKYFKEKTWYLTAKGNFSYVEGTTEAITRTQESSTHLFQRPDADHLTFDTTLTNLTGSGGSVFFGKSGGGRIRMMSAFVYKSPGLELNDIGFVRSVDEMIQLLWFGYNVNEPFGIFKDFRLGVDQWSAFNTGGNFGSLGISVDAHSTFNNNYEFDAGLNFQGNNNSFSMLRGGPTYTTPGEIGVWASAESDGRKLVRFWLNGWYFTGMEGWFTSKSVRTGMIIKPADFLEIKIVAQINPRVNHQQYVEEVEYEAIDEKRYVLGTIDQSTINATLRIDLNITPDISLQYWGQPFFGTGEYSQFKHVTNTTASDYNDRFHIYTDDQISFNEDNEMYSIDENVDGIEDYAFENPDFNNKVFLSNMVFRWEYRPGSVLFLVWSQSREDYDLIPNYTFADNLENMFDFQPHNTFLVKLSYRIGL